MPNNIIKTFENYYNWYYTQLPGVGDQGIGNFNADDMQKAMNVELKTNTNNYRIARKNAINNLSNNPDYYKDIEKNIKEKDNEVDKHQKQYKDNFYVKDKKFRKN